MEKFKYYFSTAEKIETVLNGPIDKATMKSVLFHLIWDAYYNHTRDEAQTIKYVENWLKGKTNAFHLASYAKDISRMLKTVKKMPWRDIKEPIKIRKSELDYITSFEDIRKEKLLFCYLAIAKFNDATRDVKTHWENESDTAVFKMARVNISASDRDFFIYDLIYKDGCRIYMNSKDDDTSKRIDFVSDDEGDEVVLELWENNYHELAFTYLNWKNNGGYKECKTCGRLFKVRTNAQYCKKCSPKYHPIETKTIACIDCGDTIVIDGRSNRKVRCDECQHKKHLEYQRNSMKKMRM